MTNNRGLTFTRYRDNTSSDGYRYNLMMDGQAGRYNCVATRTQKKT